MEVGTGAFSYVSMNMLNWVVQVIFNKNENRSTMKYDETIKTL